MGEGQDKVARSLLDLEPSAILDLFLVYPDYTNSKDIVYGIHNGSVFKKGVVWQGRTYMPIGMEIDGIEINADGRINRPKIKISNKDYFVTSLLRKFDDFQSARIVQKRTFVKYLDDENFDGGNPFGESDSRAEISSQEYIVAQKSQENKIFVEFELTSPFDLDNFQLNHRRIMGKYCYWQYRGAGCNYKGIPIHKDNGEDFKDIDGNPIFYSANFQYGNSIQEYSDTEAYTTGDLVFTRSSLPSQSYESEAEETVGGYICNYYTAKTDVQGLRPDLNSKYWDKDGCNKKLSSCKLRFNQEGLVSKFAGTDTTEIDSASFNIDNQTNDHFLRERTVTYNAANQTAISSSSESFSTIKNQNQWTLAFNLKELKNLNYTQRLFDTRYGSNPTYLGLLTAEPNILQLYVYENNNGSPIIRKISAIRDFPLTNHPIIVRQNNEKSISLIEPSIESNNTLDLATNIDKNFVRQLYFGLFNNGSAPITSTPMVIDSICMWRKALTDAEIENLYRKATDGGLRAKKYSELEGNPLRNNVVNWWEGAFIDDPDAAPAENVWPGETSWDGIKDLENQKDLILLRNDPSNDILDGILTVDTNSYNYNIEQQLPTYEGNPFLPFGGFPGTDGYGFFRDA